MNQPTDNSPSWRQRADTAWSKAVRARGVCQCGPENCAGLPLEAHHVILRSHRLYRHSLENGVCTCRFHHEMAHACPIAFRGLLMHKQPVIAAFKEQRKHEVGRPQESYREATARLEGGNMTLWIIGMMITCGFRLRDEDEKWIVEFLLIIFWPIYVGFCLREWLDGRK